MNCAKGIADYLAIIGQPISTHDLLLYVIGGVGSNYISFVASMNIHEALPSLSAFESYLEGNDSMLHKQL